ncbi:hypothetical protein JK364_51125 [Streptomyces sp. 110]|uniref:Uncharacterized protein n=1 Tax=Streptomyces endocoffeicus TaxID=2898945 RepID=A0ABS1Q7E3_9ACTN|nr:hypothetical protein [Streptomyces endocoffeicus]MBL1120587.1 hypothetical protein [Streptomyces endocoffeicus]
MSTKIRLSGAQAQSALVELSDWLSREDLLRGRISIERGPIQPEQMGAISDVLLVALSANGAGVALATSLSVWIKHRRPSIDLEVTNENGQSVTVHVRDAPAQDIEPLLRKALEK